MILRAEDIRKQIYQQVENRTQVYKNILQMCYNKIKHRSKAKHFNNWCLFQIPRIKFGIPLYNFDKCVKFLIQALRMGGFNCQFSRPNLLYVDWIPPKLNNNYKKLEYLPSRV